MNRLIITYWIIAAAVFGVIEILTLGLTTIWFAGGALAGAAMAALGFPITVQLIVFFVVTGLLLVITRPIATRYLNNRVTKTNVDSLIGMTGIVMETIDNLKAQGQVQVNGQVWSARSSSEEHIINEQEKVEILAVSGVKLIVKEKGGD